MLGAILTTGRREPRIRLRHGPGLSVLRFRLAVAASSSGGTSDSAWVAAQVVTPRASRSARSARKATNRAPTAARCAARPSIYESPTMYVGPPPSERVRLGDAHAARFERRHQVARQHQVERRAQRRTDPAPPRPTRASYWSAPPASARPRAGGRAWRARHPRPCPGSCRRARSDRPRATDRRPAADRRRRPGPATREWRVRADWPVVRQARPPRAAAR